ncbi:MAG: hypothetical protein ACJ8H8_17000 [Geminicoccaceae bacterium]
MEMLLGFLGLPLLLAVPGVYVWVQAKLLRRWVGGWWLAAGLPLLGWAVWTGAFARDIARDPTSHNLFPFEILIGAVAALGYLGCLALLRRTVAALRR